MSATAVNVVQCGNLCTDVTLNIPHHRRNSEIFFHFCIVVLVVFEFHDVSTSVFNKKVSYR